MSVEQYQAILNTIDREIADLEKKKSGQDKKAAEAHKKASGIRISKTASSSKIKTQIAQTERYTEEARKAESESAALGSKIADKRKKRNDAYQRLQKEEQAEKKKQDKVINDMKISYEKRITELGLKNIHSIKKMVQIEDVDKESEYDVFVSHAWEDKESFVDEFVQCLCDREIKVWYDRERIKWGDSMRTRIDAGLRKSKFGVAILSPDYISDGKYWTKTELDGLFQLESVNGKVLLPIWHNLTKKQVMDFSPILASKLAMTTASKTADEIADELLKMLEPEGESNNG